MLHVNLLHSLIFFIFFFRFLFFIFLESLFVDLIHLTFVILTWKKELNYIILPDYFFRNLFGWNRENGYDTVYSSSLKKDADQNLIIYLSPAIFWCFLFSVTKSILMSSWSHNLHRCSYTVGVEVTRKTSISFL